MIFRIISGANVRLVNVETYDKRHCVETEEYEICFGTNVGQSYRVELGNNNRANCACTGTDVYAFCTDVGWENLWVVSVPGKEGVVGSRNTSVP